MKDFWKRVLSMANQTMFPEGIKCIFCGKDINHFDEKPFCNECQNELLFNDGKRCKVCDMPINGESEVCDFCKTNHKHFYKARAMFEYDGKVRSCLLNFKSNNQKYLAKPIAFLMYNSLPDDMKNFDIILPVPLSNKSLKQRGFNQSGLLANEIAKISGKPTYENVLLKTKETEHQKELTFKDRQQNLSGAFKIENRKLIKGKNVLLVDDVMTTGATANACSEILKKFSNKVYVLTFARNVPKEDVKKKKNPKK